MASLLEGRVSQEKQEALPLGELEELELLDGLLDGLLL
jgi:hypothetical protein